MNDINSLLGKYNYSVPRYTSFPPATQFTDDLTDARYAKLIPSLPKGKAVSLYIHIPFCHSLCLFCGCNTKIVSNYSPIQSYVEILLAEIKLIGESLAGKLPVNLLHFGGGSPNYLKPDDLEGIIDRCKEFFDFNDNTQIDIESDPRYLTDDIIKCFAKIGVTRVSLGVQDFNRDVQEAINRIQPFEQVEKCVQNLRDHGIEQINFDLIIGLPRQTLESVIDTAEQAASLRPNRFAIFPYAHVPWMKKHQKLLEKYPMADGAERHLMNEAVDKVLKSYDYKAIGTDHYALADDPLCLAQEQKQLKRNFQGYTTDISEAIIGFGLSSISSYKSAYTQNTIDPVAYRNEVNKGNAPTSRGILLSEDDQRLRLLIEEIMCNFEVDMSRYSDVLSNKIGSITQKLSELEKDGLITIDDGYLKITNTGKPFTRVVASSFDPYFEIKEDRHAKAI